MFVPRSGSWISSPYHPHCQPVRVRTAASTTPSKTISIPVHFVRSDESPVTKTTAMDPETAAKKVQRVARGFLVRSNVKVVREIEAEVEKIGSKIEGEKEAIGREERERLRVSEMLMGVLFKLDSVRGVREYRKKVVRRAVALQEALDSIANNDSGRVEGGDEGEKANGGVRESDVGSCGEICVLEESHATDTGSGALELNPVTEGNATLEEEVETDGAEPDIVEGGTREEEGKTGGASSGKSCTSVEANHVWASEAAGRVEDAEGNKGVKEAVEMVIRESQRMNALMAQVLETNAGQTRMIRGLSQRVDDLSRKVERMEKKRKERKKRCPRPRDVAGVGEW